MEYEMIRHHGNQEESLTCRPRLWAATILMLVPWSLSCAASAKSDAFQPGRVMGVVQNSSLDELSGIAASRRNPGVLYVHNDSGDAARIYAITENAQWLGECMIQGAKNQDWEDIAVGPGPEPNRPYIYIGDIGDNGAKRPEVVVYRVPEPKVDAGMVFGRMGIGPTEAIRLTYPDGPRDAETLLVDPLTRDIYIMSKRELFPKVYRAAYPQSTDQLTKLEQVATLPLGMFPTGGDISPDGRRVIVRGMFGAALWERRVDKPLWCAFQGRPKAIPVAAEPQGEAICFDRQGAGYFTISEGKQPRLYYFAPAEPNRPVR